MTIENDKSDAFHRTDRQGVLQTLRDEVGLLVLPHLGSLRVIQMERRAALRGRDDELARAQEAVSCDGLASAIALMMPDAPDDSDGSVVSAPYVRVLPKLIRKED